jgi:transposase
LLKINSGSGYCALSWAQDKAHARRKFSEAVKGQGKNKRQGKAQQGLAWFQKLYRIEKQARTQQLSPQARKLHRQQHAAPILEKLREWLDASLPTVPPGTLAGKALNYLHNEWPKLVRYLEDGRLEIDNNLPENAIRPFVIGRKNWMFSDSVHGVKASANLYSLVESAKANGLEPYQYLRRVFTALPQAETVEDIEALLPWTLKKISAETW